MNTYHLTLSIVCVILVLMIIYKMFMNSNRMECYRAYMRCLKFSFILGIVNIIDCFIDGKDLGIGTSLHYTINTLTLILVLIIFYNWFIYSEDINESKLINTKKKRFLFYLPILLLIFLSLMFFNKNGVIKVNENFNYVPGKYYFIFLISALTFCTYTLVVSKLRMLDKNKLFIKNKNKTINSFCLILLFSIIFSNIFLGKPHAMLGVTLGYVYSYLCFMEQLITIDPLTGLNNRGQLINILTNEIKNYDSNNELYLLMMDMDYFKVINDTYGHVEGDVALVTVATILNSICGDRNYFVARFGGDEFNIIVNYGNEDDVKRLCLDIQSELDNYNLNSNKPYKLLMSIGYKKYSKKFKTITDYIDSVDSELYRVKKERKGRLRG